MRKISVLELKRVGNENENRNMYKTILYFLNGPYAHKVIHENNTYHLVRVI